MAIKWLIDASYFVAAILFILGLKGMSSPVSARKGIVWAGVGMVLATVVTFLTPGMGNMLLMIIAIALGGALAWVSGKRVAMTDMPQMVAIYNGMGGGAAAEEPQLSRHGRPRVREVLVGVDDRACRGVGRQAGHPAACRIALRRRPARPAVPRRATRPLAM